MTVVFFARLFYPHVGGVEKHVFEISTRLLKKGFQVIVITELSDERDKLVETVQGIKIYRINPGKQDWFKKFRVWKELWQLKEIIKNSDVIHCHDVFFWYFPMRLLYPSKPVYVTFHGYEGYPVKLNAIVVRKVSELLTWGNICIGEFIKKWYHTKPTIVSFGGVDLKEFKNVEKYKNKYSAIFVGRLDDQTGILTYSQAISRIKEKYPAFEFLIIGDGPLKLQLKNSGKLVGFQKHPEKYLPDYHFTFVSRYLSILESFASKKLVFAVYDNPVKKDYLIMSPFSSYIVIAGGAEALRSKVMYYLENPEKEAGLVSKAYAWVQNHTWDNMVDDYTYLWSRKGSARGQ